MLKQDMRSGNKWDIETDSLDFLIIMLTSMGKSAW